jgi:hypothetical protein
VAKYYASAPGTSVMRTGGVLPPPDGWTEITEEEFHSRLAASGQDYDQMPVRNLSDVQEVPA